jgi:3-phenylpropionate/trans-cinnamate dioxygenase ferredoxin reductase subunit
MSARGIIIVGAGESGASTARSLRENGWSGPVTILGEEALPPYERPPLSKSTLTDAGDPTPIAIFDPVKFEELKITSVYGARVLGIDRSRRAAITSAHGEFPYERLVLATGASARRLSIEGAEHALALRTFDDACALRQRLCAGMSLIVIGGGFIGLEVAASARQRGVAVTVLEAASRILSRAVPEDLAQRLAARHATEGVELLVGCTLKSLDHQADRYVVELADGRMLTADLVVAGVGSAPRTELAATVGLEVDNGVEVNGALQTSDPDIFAVGDCCSFPHPLYGGKRIRLEAWRNAHDQGSFVGRCVLGDSGEYQAVPWFWSDQYDLHLQIAGLPSEGGAIVKRDLGEGSTMDFHLTTDGRLVAASALGAIDRIGQDARIAEKLIAARARPDADFLSTSGSKLRALLSA